MDAKMKKTVASLIATILAATSLIAVPQAVVFDFGGVLTGEPNREAVIAFIRESFHFSAEEFEHVNQEKRLAVKQGKTDEEFWIAYAKNKGIELPANWIVSFRSAMKDAIGINPEMVALVDQLKEQQIPVALLSNIDERLSKLIRNFGLYEPFEPCLLSCEIGIEKPDLKAYELLLKMLNFPARDVVFIDDKFENIEAAKTIGLDAILFQSAKQARQELEKRELFQDVQQHKIERRAAFDIGSGQIKMQVSDVDLTANKIVDALFTDIAYVGLRENLVNSLDGRLSSDIQNQTVDAISALIKKAAPFHPEAYHAIATEAFRLAKNGDVLVERIKKETGVPVTIVSQEEEGILGFISAVSEADVDLDRVVSWDFGGGSFQITTKCGDHYSVYQGRLGKIPMKSALLKIQGKDGDQMLSPNPISKSQAMEAIQFVKDTIQDVPIELRQKLNHPDVVVLGIGINPLWGMRQSADFDSSRILKEIDCRLHLDDAAIRAQDAILTDRQDAFTHVVSNLILAYGVMIALEIPQVHYVGLQSANAIGALLSPKYWENSKEMN